MKSAKPWDVEKVARTVLQKRKYGKADVVGRALFMSVMTPTLISPNDDPQANACLQEYFSLVLRAGGFNKILNDKGEENQEAEDVGVEILTKCFAPEMADRMLLLQDKRNTRVRPPEIQDLPASYSMHVQELEERAAQTKAAKVKYDADLDEYMKKMSVETGTELKEVFVPSEETPFDPHAAF